MKKLDPKCRELFEAILKLETAEEAERFFEDLCTPAELVSMSDRWSVAQLLSQGVSYRTIYQRTGVSTATVTRVARALIYGEDGYRTILKRMATGPKPTTKPVKPATRQKRNGYA